MRRRLRIAVDESRPIGQLRSILDAARDGHGLECGFDFALSESHFDGLPEWLRDARRPHEALWVDDGPSEDSNVDATNSAHVWLGIDRLTVSFAGVVRADVSRDENEIKSLMRLFDDRAMPANSVGVHVDPHVDVGSLLRVLDVVQSARRSVRLRITQ